MFPRVLALSPHTDDVEVAAGATVAKLLDHDAHITHLAFSWCDDPRLCTEWHHANDALGITDRTLYGFPRRTFPTWRQAILDQLITWRNQHDPYALILCPCSTDIHQDHHVIHQEALRAFRRTATLWGYIMPWNTMPPPNPTLYTRLRDTHITRKHHAIACYTTQHHLPQFHAPTQHHLLHPTPNLHNTRYTEAFEILRWIW